MEKKKQLNVNYLDIRTHFGEEVYYKPVSLGIFIATFMLIIEVMVTKSNTNSQKNSFKNVSLTWKIS